MLRFIYREAALILKTPMEKLLVIPDLHLGFEKELSLLGLNIPSQTEKLYCRVEALVKHLHPDRLIFLGDVKHGAARILPHEWVDVPSFFERLVKLVEEVDVIPGNHDGDLEALLPPQVSMYPSKGLMVRDGRRRVYLMHGHTWPLPEAFSCDYLIMGHHHFTVELKESSGLRMNEPVWFTARLKIESVVSAFLKSMGHKGSGDPLKIFERVYGSKPTDPKIIVMPTFNAMLKGASVNRPQKRGGEYLGPIFRSGRVDVERSELYLLDGTYLGRLADFKSSTS